MLRFHQEPAMTLSVLVLSPIIGEERARRLYVSNKPTGHAISRDFAAAR